MLGDGRDVELGLSVLVVLALTLLDVGRAHQWFAGHGTSVAHTQRGGTEGHAAVAAEGVETEEAKVFVQAIGSKGQLSSESPARIGLTLMPVGLG